ncbi:MAG TPA: YiiX/YebB-like N1pC/P60 family cysteine hydrolase [Candidatus Binatia bacterium]|nr:YiiX/YebB-like N1pC/P60 family cysteine hydrolase [Candidatus Binatia bacterium]
MAGWLRSKVFDFAARMLTKPRGSYTLLLPNDFESLLRALKPGDVILVDGDQRISEVIKYLTQSTWSHSVLYVGDEILHRFPGQREALLATHGRDAHHMIIEALVEGVVASPLSKYASFNLRICRPSALQREDLQRVMNEVLAQLGLKYDMKNVFDLARYFFPVSLIPRRFRRRALQFGSGLPTQVICSSLIGRAFQNVGFPILPTTTISATPAIARRFVDRVFRRALPPYPALFRRQVPSIITPRDFDLSPYFEIIKFNPVEASNFDYRRIRWDDGDVRAAGGSRSGS